MLTEAQWTQWTSGKEIIAAVARAVTGMAEDTMDKTKDPRSRGSLLEVRCVYQLPYLKGFQFLVFPVDGDIDDVVASAITIINDHFFLYLPTGVWCHSQVKDFVVQFATPGINQAVGNCHPIRLFRFCWYHCWYLLQSIYQDLVWRRAAISLVMLCSRVAVRPSKMSLPR